MAIYNTEQLSYTGATLSTAYHTRAMEWPRTVDSEDNDYQQIILPLGSLEDNQSINPVALTLNNSYYCKLKLPRDENYNLTYSIRLLNLNDFGNPTRADLDSSTSENRQQFIKYITVPKQGAGDDTYDKIIFYQLKENNKYVQVQRAKTDTTDIVDDIQTAIYLDKDDISNINNVSDIYTLDYLKNKVIQFMVKDDNDNDITKYRIYDNTGEFKDYEEAEIGKQIVTLNKTWYTSENVEAQYSWFEFVFSPAGTGFNAIYLKLESNAAIDNGIRWKRDTNSGDSITYVGRHIDVTKIEYQLYEISPIIYQSNNLWKNRIIDTIGVWGRSNLLMCIDGEEIRIGPSGHYELKDYPIQTLAIVAADNNDKYTVDVKYTS